MLYCFAENWIQILCLKGYDCIIIGKLSIIDSIQYLSKREPYFAILSYCKARSHFLTADLALQCNRNNMSS